MSKRVLKFRGWDSESQCMYLHKDLMLLDFGELLENDEIIIMQFTGIYDKEGNEIYEGDIIQREHTHQVRSKYVADWEQSQSRTGFNVRSSGNKLRGGVVIGNIYENPKLEGRE